MLMSVCGYILDERLSLVYVMFSMRFVGADDCVPVNVVLMTLGVEYTTNKIVHPTYYRRLRSRSAPFPSLPHPPYKTPPRFPSPNTSAYKNTLIINHSYKYTRYI